MNTLALGSANVPCTHLRVLVWNHSRKTKLSNLVTCLQVIPSQNSHHSRRHGKSLEQLHRSSPDLRSHSARSGHSGHPSSPELRTPSAHSRRSPSAHSRRSRGRDDDSDIYVTSAAYQHAPSRLRYAASAVEGYLQSHDDNRMTHRQFF